MNHDGITFVSHNEALVAGENATFDAYRMLQLSTRHCVCISFFKCCDKFTSGLTWQWLGRF